MTCELFDLCKDSPLRACGSRKFVRGVACVVHPHVLKCLYIGSECSALHALPQLALAVAYTRCFRTLGGLQSRRACAATAAVARAHSFRCDYNHSSVERRGGAVYLPAVGRV
jgi:hypothetical protein